MAWSIEFTPRAAKSFRKLDKPVQKQISKFLREVAEMVERKSTRNNLVLENPA